MSGEISLPVGNEHEATPTPEASNTKEPETGGLNEDQKTDNGVTAEVSVEGVNTTPDTESGDRGVKVNSTQPEDEVHVSNIPEISIVTEQTEAASSGLSQEGAEGGGEREGAEGGGEREGGEGGGWEGGRWGRR